MAVQPLYLVNIHIVDMFALLRMPSGEQLQRCWGHRLRTAAGLVQVVVDAFTHCTCTLDCDSPVRPQASGCGLHWGRSLSWPFDQKGGMDALHHIRPASMLFAVCSFVGCRRCSV